MFRRTEQTDPATQLEALLKNKLNQLEKFFKPADPDLNSRELRDSLTDKELIQLRGILEDLPSLEKAFDAVVDKGINDLEAYGMSTNPITGQKENIFSKFPTPNVDIEGKAFDNSVYKADENFGDVLKKANSITYGDDGQGKKGIVRSQAHTFMMESYQKSTKKSENIGDRFLSDLIDIRAQEVEIFIPAKVSIDFIKDVLDPLKINEKLENIDRLGMKVGNSMIAYKQVVGYLQRANAYNHLMSVSKFSSSMKQTDAIKDIIKELTLLHETTASPKFFGRSAVALSDEDRLAHLAILKSHLKALPAEVLSNTESKECIDKLKLQVDYAKFKTISALEKTARLSIDSSRNVIKQASR